MSLVIATLLCTQQDFTLVIATLLCTQQHFTCNCYIAMYSTRFHLYLLHCYVLHKWSLVIATLLCTQQDLLDEAIYSYNLYCITLAINQLSDRNFYTRFRTRFFGAPEFTPCFSAFRVALSLVFVVPFLLAIVLSVLLRLTASHYPFGWLVWFMVFNATYNNISLVLVESTTPIHFIPVLATSLC